MNKCMPISKSDSISIALVWVIIIVHISALVHFHDKVDKKHSEQDWFFHWFYSELSIHVPLYHSHRSFKLMEGKLKPKTHKLLREIHHSLMGLNNDA